MMRFTVLSVAYPFAPVKPDTAGGAEQILGLIDAYLVERGHCSIVVAAMGSTPKGVHVPTPGLEGVVDEAVRKKIHETHRRAIEGSLRRWNVDLVHMHGLDFNCYLPPPGVPVLVTIHLPIAWYSPEAFRLNQPDIYFNCVSKSQRRTCPDIATLLSEVENGVPVERLSVTEPKKKAFVLSMDRICPEEGFHIAVSAADRAKIPIIIAGEVFPYKEHTSYFRNVLQPRLGRMGRFIGAIDFEHKRHLLSSARCLLVPSLIPETSSLVTMEALACGTPVVAFPNGALPELIEEGKTGYLVKDEHEMAEAIGRCRGIDPEDCRKSARERFTAERMSKSYLELYGRIIFGTKANG